MQSLHNILKKFVKDFNFDSGIVLNAVRSQWESTVGQTIAMHTFPDTIKGKVLTLLVDTPQWMHHLSFYKEDITEKLKPYDIKSIRFKLGRIPERKHERPEREDIKLSEDDLRYIENTVKNIDDEGLKEKFRELITHGLMKGRRLR
jgi:hypothetical protein